MSRGARSFICLQRRRPRPVAETGRSCWGSGQRDASGSAADAGSRNPALSNEVRLRGCTKTGLPSVARPALLRHIGNAPVHWHEETFSSGGILLSDENATVFLTSSDLQPVAPTQIATLNAICFFFNRIKIFQASIPQAERISYTVLFHALPVTLLSEDYRGQ